MSKYTFTDEEKKAVEQAVKDLETVSCGEIVPFFVRSSDEYREASWFLSVVMGILTIGSIAMLSYLWLLPFQITPLEQSLLILAVMVVGYFLPMVFPTIKRFLVSKDRQSVRVQQRAMEAFLSEQVFATEERVGVLIFISRLEHQVLVLGDEGINIRVKPDDWQHVVDEVVKGIKQHEIGQGLVRAIELCKELLLANGFKRKSTDTNELDDGLRIED
ncbi:TPM domain-containing protein [Marinoscillum furvescens]|uniref:Putative membrane protein n=1 Tax=Marinoscillum furvescens DSM 4134 TaxID=1122208 RepID=A0A3D9LFV9_MARFU|nr:hypothetical protein [Marinoscillum furvescens]REE05550.1 putative membrane protein [Marinoscillum furvescens DSM 4134]